MQKRVMRFAAVFLVCFMTMGTVAIGTSEAFRKQVFSFFNNADNGSVTLRNESEYDYIGSWDEYWYPQWLPEGFYMLGAIEEEHLMVFVNENSSTEIRIHEYGLNSSISMDTDLATVEIIQVDGKEVILHINEIYRNITALWMTDCRYVEIRVKGSTDKAMVKKIIENMKFVKK